MLQTFLNGKPANDYIFQAMAYDEQIESAGKMLREADAVLISAGAGLSAAAGLTYSGKRFTDYFSEYISKYGGHYMKDMYSAGFYPFPTEESRWGYWARHSYFNRILPQGLPVYKSVYEMVKEKPHFVLTTNVDHQFQKSGFEEQTVFATQGDYGLIQCAKGCHQKTYSMIEGFQQMVQATKDCNIPSYMVPKCPVCHGPMAMNLRCDSYFVEDEDWHKADNYFHDFLTENLDKKMVLLELGVGFNTPTIIRFPFEHLVREHQNISLIRLNLEEAVIPESFGTRAIGINADIAQVLEDVRADILLKQ